MVSPPKKRRNTRASVDPFSTSPGFSLSSATPTTPSNIAEPVVSYDFFDYPLLRCHIEDLIEIAPGTPVLLLIPEDDSSYTDFLDMSKEQRDRQKVNINGRLYLQLDGFVKSNPKRDLILRMMHDKTDASSFIEELYTKDEGINILISKNPRDLIQIRWNQFHANPRGVQIWAAMAHP